jgi:CheY-like chemotaxis protein
MIRALVAENDAEARSDIEDACCSLGHGFDWADSQQDARELLLTKTYDYGLYDLELPARTGQKRGSVEYGRALVRETRAAAGRTGMPVIIMTGNPKDGVDMARELFLLGATDLISKPFSKAGRTLPRVITDALHAHARAFPPGTIVAEPTPFRGGVLAYYQDHLELLGECVLDADGPGHAWEIMQAMRKLGVSGKRARYSAPRLADILGQGVTENAVSSCIHDLRGRFIQRMLDCNISCGTYDVIDSRLLGYRLTDWITVESHDTPVTSPAKTPVAVSAPSAGAGQTGMADPLSERQHWVLDQLRDGVRLTRNVVEKKFGVGPKQAKRELAVLTARGLVDFVRKPKPGYYVLKTKAAGK